MSFREDILEAIEDVRDIPGELDIRQFRIFVVVTTWSGTRVGVGNPTVTESELLVSGYPPRVQELSPRDVAASGGLFAAGDLRVGPITPAHASGGTAASVHNPPTSNNPTAVTFKMLGPDMGAEGVALERVSSETLKNFSHFLVLRRTARRP